VDETVIDQAGDINLDQDQGHAQGREEIAIGEAVEEDRVRTLGLNHAHDPRLKEANRNRNRNHLYLDQEVLRPKEQSVQSKES